MNAPAVWVGEMLTRSTFTCDPADLYYGYRGYREEGYAERVVLILERRSDTDAFTGRISIGEGAPPVSPQSMDPRPMDDWFWFCSVQLPTRGFEYTVLDPSLSGRRMQFDIAANELWDGWCESRDFGCEGGPCERFPPCNCEAGPCTDQFQNQGGICHADGIAPVCRCEGGACHATLDHRVSFDLIVTDEGLEGTADGFPELRLRRVQ